MDTNKNTRKEGAVAKAIEKQTSKIPSDVFLWTAVASMAASLVFKVMGKNSKSTFVGQWAAPLLILGLYNKLVKLEGHDKDDKKKNEEVSTEEVSTEEVPTDGVLEEKW